MAELSLPEHDKLRALDGKNDDVARFLEWLSYNGISLSKNHEHEEGCGELTVDFNNPFRRKTGECGYYENELVPIGKSIEEILAAYFEIDLKKLEEEKQEILKSIRQ